MVKHSHFFEENRQAAAILKHGVLRRYLPRYAGMVGSTSLDHRVGYVDGFAGSGVYINPITGHKSPGSPQIALDVAADLGGRSLECVFIEKSRRHYSSLNSVVLDAKDSRARALHGDIRAHMADALNSFSEIPLLVFLDPFGTALEVETVIQILRRQGGLATEVLLNFSIEAVRRIGGRLFEHETAKGRNGALKTMDSWLGGDWWRSIFLDSKVASHPDGISRAADLVYLEYVRRVNTAASSSSFVVAIRKQPHHKPIFYLTLFYLRSYAVMPFNECVSMATQDWRLHLQDLDLTKADLVEYLHPPLPGLSRVDELKAVFADDEIAFKLDTIDAIVSSIRNALLTRPAISTRANFDLVFGAAAGTGRSMHLRAAWDRLAEAGEVLPRVKNVSMDNAQIRRVQPASSGWG